MPRKLVTVVLVLFVSVSVAAGVIADSRSNEKPIVFNAWVRATAFETTDDTDSGQETSHDLMRDGTYGPTAAYMSIENPADSTIRLIGAHTPVAGITEIHETTMQDEVMRMSPVEYVTILPGEHALFQPGGLHLMLMDLDHDLIAGEAITLTLTFEVLNEDGDADNEITLVIGAPVQESPVENPETLIIRETWARPTATEPTMEHDDALQIPPSAAYMLITNRGEETITILSATSSLAEATELHITEMDGDIMRMVELEDGITILPGEDVELRPRGMHIMLMRLTKDLLSGDALTLVFTLDNGDSVIIGVPVVTEAD